MANPARHSGHVVFFISGVNTSGPTTPQRRIAHLDMDAFYAPVELLRYPQRSVSGSAPTVVQQGRL